MTTPFQDKRQWARQWLLARPYGAYASSCREAAAGTHLCVLSNCCGPNWGLWADNMNTRFFFTYNEDMYSHHISLQLCITILDNTSDMRYAPSLAYPCYEDHQMFIGLTVSVVNYPMRDMLLPWCIHAT
jgi:hypothetical protein